MLPLESALTKNVGTFIKTLHRNKLKVLLNLVGVSSENPLDKKGIGLLLGGHVKVPTFSPRCKSGICKTWASIFEVCKPDLDWGVKL